MQLLVDRGRRVRRRPMRALAASVACSVVAACTPAPDDVPTEPAVAGLRLVGETELEESDSLYVGKPVGLAIGANGDYYVSDAIEARVVRFDRTGRLVATYGRKGAGPGEFLGVSQVALPGDTILLASDVYRSHVTAFDLRTGSYLYDVPFRGNSGSIRAHGGRVWMGLGSSATQTGVGWWPMGSREVRRLVGYPDAYRRDIAVATLYSRVQVEPLGDSLLVGFEGISDLLVTDTTGAVLHSFRIPVAQRRGIPDDLSARLHATKTTEERFRLASLLFALGRLSDGRVVVVYTDQEYTAQAILRTGFVSVLSPDLERACVDLPLDLSRDGMTWVAFRGDTLVTFEQEVLDDRARLVSRDYLIDTDGCEWQDVARPPARLPDPMTRDPVEKRAAGR